MLRNYCVVALVMALLLGFAGMANAATSATTKLRINLRQDANLESRIVAITEKGDVLTVLDQQGEFAQVLTASGKRGFLKTKYLKWVNLPAEETAQPAPAPQPQESVRPVPAQAATPVAPPEAIRVTTSTASSPWYGLLMGGVSLSGTSASSLQHALQAAGPITVRDLDESATAFSVVAGYRFHPNWAIEGGVLSLGEYTGSFLSSGADIAAVQRILADEHPVGGAGISLALQGNYDLGAWKLAARAGLFNSFDTDIDITLNNQTIHAEGEKFSPLLGISALYALTRHWGLGVAVNALKLNDSVVTMGGVVSYRP